ncbi:MAG: DJ-1/PfpI family protein [Phormidesmis sp.]
MRQQTVHLFVLNGLADWEVGFAIAGINNPAFQKHPGRYHIQTVGLSAEPVTTLGGLTILPDVALSDLDARASALLILPGSENWDAGRPR